MDDIRPELRQALADMNWEDRLEQARARRKAVLAGRVARDEVHLAGKGPPIVTSVEELERLRFGSDAETDIQMSSSGGQNPSVWRRAARTGLVSCVIIGIALGGMFVGGQVWNGAPLAVEEGPALLSAENSAPEARGTETPPSQRPLVTEALVPDGEALKAEAPFAFTEIGGVIASPVPIVAPNGLGVVRTATRPSFQPDALVWPRRDAMPDVGPPPESAARQMAVLSLSDAPALGEPAAPLLSPDLPAIDAGVDSIEAFATNRVPGPARGIGAPHGVASPLPAFDAHDPFEGRLSIIDPERPEHLAALSGLPVLSVPLSAPPIAVVSFDDNEPGNTTLDGIARVPAAGVMPEVDPVPPRQMISGAEAKSVFVFAAATTGEDIVGSVQGVAESFNLPVRAISRVGYGISEDQVRFYDTPSAAAARRLAEEIGAALRDFTRSDLNPPDGTIEIYLAGEAADVPQPPSTASPPARRPQLSEAQKLRNTVLSRLRNGVPR